MNDQSMNGLDCRERLKMTTGIGWTSLVAGVDGVGAIGERAGLRGEARPAALEIEHDLGGAGVTRPEVVVGSGRALAIGFGLLLHPIVFSGRARGGGDGGRRDRGWRCRSRQCGSR